MRRSEYEQRRRALEEIHQADLGLIRSAHEARVRSLEALWLAGPEEDTVESPAPAPRLVRPPLAQALDDALPRLPEAFDKNDVVRALGWTPDRGALFRALDDLVHQRRIAVERFGAGRVTTVYRKK